MSIQPSFQGEVQMRRWSDSSTQGVQVTFALHDSEALEPLKAKAGKRFMAVLVEIGDDEQPAEPTPADKRAENWRALGPNCRRAISLVESEAFQRFAQEQGGLGALAYLLKQCGIESRNELDTNPLAAGRLLGLEQSFQRWRKGTK